MSTKVYENYKKIKLLGEGSFGKAYLVECESDKSFAVIKQMDIGKMSEEERKDTLMEAKILEKLKHPNIIRFREVYKTKKGKLCIVMDYADGGDLAQRISVRKGKEHFKEHQIIDYFVQICLAMKHIHDRKVLHRDLKSQNIFLTKGNLVKLGDFGIAKMLSTTNQMVKTMVGTPYYLSPEIVEGKKYSFKSDVWSMGILLYEMCTLKPPFDANSLQYLALKIVNGKYQPIPAHYSKDLKNLVTLMLSRDPSKRPRVHEILQLPIVKDRIKDFLTKTQVGNEFNHTIIHKKDLNQIHQEEQQKLTNDYDDDEKFKNSSNSKRDDSRETDRQNKLDKERESKEKELREEELRREANKIEEEMRRKKKMEQQRQQSAQGPKDAIVSSGGGGSSNRGNKPKTPSNAKDDRKEKLRNIDEKIEQLQREREEAKQLNEERKRRREEERKNFLSEIKNKSGDKKQNEIEVIWSEKNALNRIDGEDKDSDKLQKQQNQDKDLENYVVSKYDENAYEADESENPCGIYENQVDSDDMKAMNEAMMNIYLEEEENKPTEDEEEEQLDQGLLNQLNLSSEEGDANKFNGDVQQFTTFLEERLGSDTLFKVKEIIKKNNQNEDPNEEAKFKEEIESLMDEQCRLNYMPLVHALINMEEMFKYRKSRM